MGLQAWKHDNQSQYEEISASTKTLDEGDMGVTQIVTADCTITLPSTGAGFSYRIVNGGNATGAVGITLNPAAADKFMGNGYTSADNKDVVNTKATAEPGDEIRLVGHADGWVITMVKGIWAKEA